MADDVRVIGGRDLAALSRALRRQADGRERQKQLRKKLTSKARPVVPAIRANIRALPSRGESRRRGRKSLRAELARSVTLQVRTSGRKAGVSVFMNPRKMPDKKKGLPAYFEQTPGHTALRHPVFGRRDDPWVQQGVPVPGYFTRTIGPVEREATQACQEVVEQMAAEIEGT